jgi:hypothetical protein
METSKIIQYVTSKNDEREVNEVTIFSNGKIIGELECMLDSPYTIIEEIDMFLDGNSIEYNDIELKNISKEDFVIWNTKDKAPIEAYDTVYHYTSVIELLNDGFKLNEEEIFMCVAELPISEQKKYSYEYEKML